MGDIGNFIGSARIVRAVGLPLVMLGLASAWAAFGLIVLRLA
ncbi:hypothetical protein [Sphingomonas sp.]